MAILLPIERVVIYLKLDANIKFIKDHDNILIHRKESIIVMKVVIDGDRSRIILYSFIKKEKQKIISTKVKWSIIFRKK